MTLYDFLSWNYSQVQKLSTNNAIIRDYESTETKKIADILISNDLNHLILIQPNSKDDYNFLIEILINKALYPLSLSKVESHITDLSKIPPKSLVLVYQDDLTYPSLFAQPVFKNTDYTIFNYSVFIKF